jgi:sugar lactone lactonase YvrE
MPDISITKAGQYDIPCKLGEGLCVRGKNACWVDIDSNRVFCSNGSLVTTYFLTSKPSVIYDFNDLNIELGTDSGLVCFDRIKELEANCLGFPSRSPEVDVSEYRSNDGGDCGQHRLLGFMHRNDPEGFTGSVYSVSGQQYRLLDSNISIPNSFIPLSSTETLVSDSMTGEIWCFELGDSGSLKSKTLWASLNKAAPDGGCMVDDYVLIAIWDAAEIAVFTRQGELVQMLSVPVLRPTNCKFDHLSSQLWVTSATTGLTSTQIPEYPDSGKTMLFNLRMS